MTRHLEAHADKGDTIIGQVCEDKHRVTSAIQLLKHQQDKHEADRQRGEVKQEQGEYLYKSYTTTIAARQTGLEPSCEVARIGAFKSRVVDVDGSSELELQNCISS